MPQGCEFGGAAEMNGMRADSKRVKLSTPRRKERPRRWKGSSPWEKSQSPAGRRRWMSSLSSQEQRTKKERSAHSQQEGIDIKFRTGHYPPIMHSAARAVTNHEPQSACATSCYAISGKDARFLLALASSPRQHPVTCSSCRRLQNDFARLTVMRRTSSPAVVQKELQTGLRIPMFGTERRFTAPDINGNAEAYHPRHNRCNQNPYYASHTIEDRLWLSRALVDNLEAPPF